MFIPSQSNQHGFTLVEILIALVVVGLLMTGLVQSVRLGSRIWSAQARQMSQTTDLDGTARSLRQLLTSIPVVPSFLGPNSQEAPSNAIAIKGEGDNLRFVGFLADGLGETRLADIILALRERKLVVLWRPYFHEKSNQPLGEWPQAVLASNIRRLEIGYWSDVEGDWVARWDRADLPQLFRVRLGFDEADRRRWPDLIAAPYLSVIK
jgi:general secretion pathway protein J